MRLAVLLAAALLAGCASPAPSGVIEAPVGSEPRAAAACAGNCSWEWWNVSVEAEGAWAAQLPLPVRFGLPGPPRAAEHAMPWAGRVQGGSAGASVGANEAGAYVQASGQGPATLRGALVSVAPPGETADTFLLARWGPGVGQARPEVLLAPSPIGDFSALTLTYEARSDLCWRAASFGYTERGEAGALVLVGNDTAGCA